jgi:hypothetical protein
MTMNQLEITIEKTQEEELDAELHLSRIRADRRKLECRYATGGLHYPRLTRLRSFWRAKLKNAEDTLAMRRDELIDMLEMEMA